MNYNANAARPASHRGLWIGAAVLVVMAVITAVLVWYFKFRSKPATDYAVLVDATGAPVALVPVPTDAPTSAATMMPTDPPTSSAPVVFSAVSPATASHVVHREKNTRAPMSTVAPTVAATTLSVSAVPLVVSPVTAAPPTAPIPLPGNPVAVLGAYGIAPWGAGANFPDAQAQWIWNAPGAAASAPANTVPINFSTTVVNATSATLPVTISAVVDNNSTVSLNGLQLGPANGGWTGNFPKLSATLLPGTNVLTFAATNAGAGPNPAGVLASVADAAGNVLARSDASWVWS